MAFKLPFASKAKNQEDAAGDMPIQVAEKPSSDEQAATGGLGALKAKFGASKTGKGEKAKGAKPKLPKASNRSCFVLIIGDDGGILTYVDKGAVARRLFAPSSEKQHIAPLLELLQNHPNAPIYVLCDLIDQSYVRHSLPPVSPLNVRKLLNRRLERDFAPEDITGSISLGREKEGRKEWNFMLISLANTSMLQQWIEPILEMPNRFKGLHLLPVESKIFINHLSKVVVPASSDGKKAKWQILVAHDKVGGFRQIVLKESQLIFTRLTQYSPDSPAEVTAGNVEQELQNTIEYLRRLDYDEEDGLELYFIIGQEFRDLLDVNAVNASLVKVFTPFEVSQLLDLPQSALSGDRFADVVLSTNFGLRQKPQLPLMTSYAKKLAQLQQLGMALNLVAALAVLYILYASVMAMVGWQSLNTEAREYTEQTESAQTELTRAQRRFESLGSDQTQIMRVASLYRKVERSPTDPLDFVSRFARIKSRNVEVVEWSWKALSGGEDEKKKKKDEPKLYEYSLKLEFLNLGNDRRTLSSNAKALVDLVKANFEQFSVTISELPGEKEEEQEKVVIDFSEGAEEENYELAPGDEMVTMTLVGPQEVEAKQ